MSPAERDSEYAQLQRMRVVSIVEGATLALLIGVAVPLKHLAGIPAAVSIMGLVHGLAFLTYIYMLAETLGERAWPRARAIRMIVLAIIPFGAFANERALARRQREIAG
ncbi:MAG TPA: DUF3817 domain-containing protein [Sphingobium sp.]